MLKLVVDNEMLENEAVAGQVQPATMESEFDERNPNTRALLLLPNAEYSEPDSSGK